MPVDTTKSAAALAAAALEGNLAIDAAIASIIEELRKAQRSITAVRPAAEHLRESFEHYLERHAATKGKPAYYPYVGSGIGNGPLVELADGSVKWDMISGIGTYAFGHSDPELVEIALRAAMTDTLMQGNLQFNRDAVEFGELLVNEAAKHSRIAHIFTINSGALANETALKICMQKKEGKAPRVLAFTDCFMGRTTVMCQIGDSAAGRDGIPLNVQVDYVPFYSATAGAQSTQRAVAKLRECITRYPGQHACFVFELVQGEGGFNTAPRDFFLPLMEMCREHDIPIWIDEIQTFGRTPDMFRFEGLDLGEYVDVVTVGKMTQVCGCLYTEELSPRPGLLSATFIGSTAGLNVGRRIVERLRDGDYYGESGRIARLHEAFRSRMRDFIESNRTWFPPALDERGEPSPDTPLVGGVGGMMRFTPFGGEKKKVIDACHALFHEGVIAFYCGHDPYHIRFLPPIGVMQEEQFDDVFEILERGLAKVGG